MPSRTEMVCFTTLGEALNGTAENLRIQDQVLRTYMNGREQEIKSQFVECNRKLIEVIDRAKANFGAAASTQGWQQGSSDRPARLLIDLKDQKIDKMPEVMSTEVFRTWKT